MTDKKISALTAATTPLAGTEVLPIVQSGATVKVAVNDLTAGRAITATLINKVAITTPATSATLTIADGKTLTANNSLTFAGTDATTMTFPTTSATVARTDAANNFTGNQTLSTGNLVIGTSGKGIDFSATSGTGTSELLSDYEEGTWTPTIASQTGALTSYTSIGYYTKVGRAITVFGSFVITSAGTASGIANISNLPFTSFNLPVGPDVIGTGVVREYNSTGLTYFVNIADNATTGTIVTSTNGGIVWLNNYAYLWSVTYQTA